MARARARAPFWLAQPSRYSGLARPRAIGVAIALALVALLLAAIPAPATTDPDVTGTSLYDTVIDGVRAGGGYYQLLADTLRASSAALRPFLAFRLPTHAMVQALLPREAVVVALYLLAAGVGALWWTRLAAALPQAAPRLVAMILLTGGMVTFVQADLIGFHEIWAGLLVALALGRRRPGRWVEAVAVAAIAALVRETAAVSLLVMAAFAWREGERREAAGWAIALGLVAIVLAVHAYAVAQVTGPLDPRLPAGSGLLGAGFVRDALVAATAVRSLPPPLASALVVLSLLGWSAWRDPLGKRVTTTLGVYAAAAAILADADSFAWVLMIAPLWLVGLVFLPDLVRDLSVAILDRRRVRVQRVTQ